MSATPRARVALVTLGCARNEVDSEELAARLTADGYDVTTDASGADAVLVNTCGFVEAAKADSVETLLGAVDTGAPTIAVGCLAERYGRTLADELPETTVLGFDAYPSIGEKVAAVLRGERPVSHEPTDRRTLLPISPTARRTLTRVGPDGTTSSGREVLADLAPGMAPASGPRVLRQRLVGGPVASLKLASGCDRRCAFCAIPSFRGSFVSRDPQDVLAEAAWLAADGVRELVLVSENSTSYGKDLGDLRALEKLLPQLAATEGIARVRIVYLQPAEVRPSLLETVLTTPGVAPYLDLSFQHSSAAVLRRMRRFGDTDRFLELLASARALAPELGARTNVIAGFPGETRADVTELTRFLESARLDAVGVFGYSDEDGTEAATLPDKISAPTIARRVEKLTSLVEELSNQRAEERIGAEVEVLIEQVTGSLAEGRAAHQAPEVDGSCVVRGSGLAVGDLVAATVVASEGVDLVVEARVPASLPA
jgi:ribosomal protein S12 methylthiotransferase